MSPQNVLKAGALLDSVVDSIQAPRPKHSRALSGLRTDTDVVADSSTEPEPSSATRRKNALARKLFGASDSDQSFNSPSPLSIDGPNTGSDLLAERPSLIESSSSARSIRETLSPSSPSVNASVLTPSSSSTEQLDKHQELAKEVQRWAAAAMADLNRIFSKAKVHDASQRRHVERGQISGSKLGSASTNVDTIPMCSPSAASGQLSAVQNQSSTSTKFGTPLKKTLRSLRTKPTFSTSDGSTQYPAELSSGIDDRSLASTHDGPPPFSAAEPSRSKLVIASPAATVATTGPGLKGFVSRFSSPRSGETPDPECRKQLASSYFTPQQSERNPDMDVSQQVSQSAPPDNKSFRPDTPMSPESVSPHKPPPSTPPVTSSVPDPSATRAVDEVALKQFIDAANNLGLDLDALTELLARSSSIGSRLTTQGSKHLSTPSGDRSGHSKSDPPLSGPAPLSAAGSSAHRSLVQSPQREIIEKAPIRRPLARNATTSDAAKSTIVRQIPIFPSEARRSTPDPGMGLRKNSSTRRRRSTSAPSMLSKRSLHDRVPTPPPRKSSTTWRFSAEQSPPVPHIPSSLLSQTEAIYAPQSAPAIPLEKSNSDYDSL
jgi:serine/arginine repetitive matrix protein 2